MEVISFEMQTVKAQVQLIRVNSTSSMSCSVSVSVLFCVLRRTHFERTNRMGADAQRVKNTHDTREREGERIETMLLRLFFFSFLFTLFEFSNRH